MTRCILIGSFVVGLVGCSDRDAQDRRKQRDDRTAEISKDVLDAARIIIHSKSPDEIIAARTKLEKLCDEARQLDPPHDELAVFETRLKRAEPQAAAARRIIQRRLEDGRRQEAARKAAEKAMARREAEARREMAEAARRESVARRRAERQRVARAAAAREKVAAEAEAQKTRTKAQEAREAQHSALLRRVLSRLKELESELYENLLVKCPVCRGTGKSRHIPLSRIERAILSDSLPLRLGAKRIECRTCEGAGYRVWNRVETVIEGSRIRVWDRMERVIEWSCRRAALEQEYGEIILDCRARFHERGEPKAGDVGDEISRIVETRLHRGRGGA